MSQTKRCNACKQDKDHSEFYVCKRTKDGRRSKCIACFLKEGQAIYWRDEEKTRVHNREYHKEYRKKNLELMRERGRLAMQKTSASLRTEILKMLGDVCSRCPVTDPRALHIDHIDDNGSWDRAAFTGRQQYYKFVIGQNCKDYQLLCANCNHLKRLDAAIPPATVSAKYSQDYGTRLRDKVLTLLGSKCVGCQNSDKRVLCVDHQTGGGRQDKLRAGGSNAMYRNILKDKFGYQLLCWNCNWIKRHVDEEWGK